MCYKQTMRSPLPIKLAKITVVVIFFCFAECAAGSCLSYGHACWGAHGKRNGGHNNVPIKDQPSRERDSQWFLSRLLQTPMDIRYMNEREFEVPLKQLFSDAQMEVDPFKGPEDLRNLQDAYLNEENVLFNDIYSNQRPLSNKMKVSKLLEKRSTKMI